MIDLLPRWLVTNLSTTFLRALTYLLALNTLSWIDRMREETTADRPLMRDTPPALPRPMAAPVLLPLLLIGFVSRPPF